MKWFFFYFLKLDWSCTGMEPNIPCFRSGSQRCGLLSANGRSEEEYTEEIVILTTPKKKKKMPQKKKGNTWRKIKPHRKVHKKKNRFGHHFVGFFLSVANSIGWKLFIVCDKFSLIRSVKKRWKLRCVNFSLFWEEKKIKKKFNQRLILKKKNVNSFFLFCTVCSLAWVKGEDCLFFFPLPIGYLS